VTASARTTLLPFDHLRAELTAFPLASEAALTNPFTHLDPNPEPGDPVVALWRAAEKELLSAAPGIALDDLTAMRDSCWFGDGQQTRRSLHSFLRDTTLLHMEYRGAGVVPRRPQPLAGPVSARPAHAQARQAWMWLTLALPEDLLLAAVGNRRWVPLPDLLTPAVRDLLARGFAETHLHVGASLDFRAIWSLIQRRLASPGIGDHDLEAPGAALREGKDLPAWLLRAAIARVVLATFHTSGYHGNLVGYVHSRFFRTRVINEAGAGAFSMILAALADLAQGRLSDQPRPLLQGAYADMVGTRGSRDADDVASSWALDPVAPLLQSDSGSPEQALVIRARDYLNGEERAGRPDVFAAQVFWQTVRVRNLFYRHFTQRPLTPGLPWFIRFYSRMSRARGNVADALLVDAAAGRSGLGYGLTSLEVRTSPDEAIAEICSWVRAAHCQRHAGPAEIGLAFHFIKDRDGEVAPGVPRAFGVGTTADPRASSCGCRFGNYFAGQRRAATALARLLHQWPNTLLLIRSLDVCSDELAVPSWVMKPLVVQVQQAAISGARELPDGLDGQPRPLRMTAHAGEDFSHLLTGLRWIDEAAEVLELREGDRIGHGLALGIDPEGWAARSGPVAMPMEERVLDLAWEWTWWTRRGRGGDSARLAYLGREIARLGEQWFLQRIEPLQIEHLGEDLANVEYLTAVGFPDGVPQRFTADGSRAQLLVQYLVDGPTFARGRGTVWVDPSGEVEALARISASLRAEIGRRGLAIEINPTSNLLVGDLGDLRNHPLWRMSPPRAGHSTPRLAITVGSDDPLVFNSSLPMEYQLLFDALLLAGLTDAEALEWLDRVRRTGMERRFTTPRVAIADLFALVNGDGMDLPAR
jgi:hypothetical protein